MTAEQQFSFSGILQTDSLRITGVTIGNYPMIAISMVENEFKSFVATWEGCIYFENLESEEIYLTLKPNVIRTSNIKPSNYGKQVFLDKWSCIDFCGSFVQYCHHAEMYVISRAVDNEVIIVDKSFRTNKDNSLSHRNYTIPSSI